MRLNDTNLEFSISDIVRHFRSPYSAWATWANLQQPGTVYVENDMIQHSSLLKRSEENEADAKRFLINRFDKVKTISNPLNSLEESKKLMQEKVDVIVQPTLKRDQFTGRADFIILNKDVNMYEVMDAKLAKQVKPEFLLQVCGYTWMLEKFNEGIPESGYFFLGDERSESFKINEYYRFFIDLKDEFLDTVENYSLDVHPKPRKWEVFEEFNDAAEIFWKENSSLELIADVSSRQIQVLEKEGINSIIEVPEVIEKSFPKLATESLDKIKRQASAQLQSTDDKTHIELLNGDESIHFLHKLLPDESKGDVYFDLEGFPFYDFRKSDTLEYLYGAAYKDEKGDLIFKGDLWAEDEFEEKIIFSKFINWMQERISKYPDLKIYHYAHYEITSLRNSAKKHALYEDIVEDWIVTGRFVDLYTVVRKCFLIGKDSYSLKRVEEVAGFKRELDLKSGFDSIFYFERYLDSRDPKIKEEILTYNKDDCFATEVVCNWLRNFKKVYPYDIDYTEEEHEQTWEQKKEFIRRNPGLSDTDYARELFDDPKKRGRVTNLKKEIEIKEVKESIENMSTSRFEPEVKDFLSTMLGYYNREIKVSIWEKHNLKTLPLEDKINNSSTFGYLELISQDLDEKGKNLLTYVCHDKTFKKVSKGDEVSLLHHSSEQFTEHEVGYLVLDVIDNFDGLITLKLKETYREEDTFNITNYQSCSGYVNPLPMKNYNASKSPYEALSKICNDYIEKDNIPPVVNKLLNSQTNIDLKPSAEIKNSKDKVLSIAKNMDQSYLVIQGPPGTGKSTMLGEIIAKLSDEGFRIGIAAYNYQAVLNLVKKVLPHINSQSIAFFGASGSIKDEIEKISEIQIPKKEDDAIDFDIVATTTNKICHSRYWDENKFDYLIIDEVGQVPLVTTIATTLSTRNLILIGDPNQLPQVKKGSHPNKNDLSTFEYLIGEDRVLPEDKGMFLDTTYRLHPDINNFISNYFYEDLLKVDKNNKLRYLIHEKDDLISTGVQFIQVNHTGNILASHEEIEKITELLSNLLTSKFFDGETNREVTKEDILIVAPYNLQVYELRKKLGDGFKIGTIDKFQGQEAPIVIVSFAASSSEDAPRGIEFILDFNRMNVAISRAQCLTLIVGSPYLTNLFYQNVNSIKLTNLHRVLMNSN